MRIDDATQRRRRVGANRIGLELDQRAQLVLPLLVPERDCETGTSSREKPAARSICAMIGWSALS